MVLYVAIAAITAGCSSTSPDLQNSHAGLENPHRFPQQRGKQQRPQQLTLERDSIRFTAVLVSGREIEPNFLGVRRISYKDFAPILKDGYVNYADGNNSDLLTLYNRYKEYQADRIRDYWGNPLFPEFILSPFADDDGHPTMTIIAVTVQNLRSEKIRVAPFSAALIDDTGEQKMALSKDDLFVDLEARWARASLTPFALSTPGFSREYFLRTSSQVQRAQFSGTAVFAGARASGLLFFQKFESSVKHFTFIFPDVTLLKSGRPEQSVDFELDFSNQ